MPSSEMKALNRISSLFGLFQQNRFPLQVKQDPTSLKGAHLSRSGMKNLRVVFNLSFATCMDSKMNSLMGQEERRVRSETFVLVSWGS